MVKGLRHPSTPTKNPLGGRNMGKYGTALSALILAVIFTLAVGSSATAFAAESTGGLSSSGGEAASWRSQYEYISEFSEGRAVVMKDGEWFHVYSDGNPAYDERYNHVGTFSQGRAWVKKNIAWYHILLDGEHAYDERYSFAGDFSEGRAVVRKNGDEFHILLDGKPAYDEQYDYAGNFMNGRAIVRKGVTLFYINLDGGRETN